VSGTIFSFPPTIISSLTRRFAFFVWFSLNRSCCFRRKEETSPSFSAKLVSAAGTVHLSHFDIVREEPFSFPPKPGAFTRFVFFRTCSGCVSFRFVFSDGLLLRIINDDHDRIPQAAQNMANTHLSDQCQHIPANLKALICQLQSRKSSAGGGKT
jgi:hypothetical protein